MSKSIVALTAVLGLAAPALASAPVADLAAGRPGVSAVHKKKGEKKEEKKEEKKDEMKPEEAKPEG